LSADDGYAWLGVPFAKQPVGDLRWKPPVDPASWIDVKNTQKLSEACAQVGSMYGPGNPFETASNRFWKPVGSEDCLYLNIYSPLNSQAGSKLPVLIFVHGGSNRVGATSIYEGSILAKNTNMVVVILPYRLNLLGWLTHPALRTGEPLNDSGNYALLDLIQGLKFVKNNIANFGGDPDSVTIMGQSAGALNVNHLVLSPVAKGLFHKAIPMSGDMTDSTTAVGEFASGILIQTLLIKDSLATDAASAAAFLATKDNTWIANYLRGKSTADIINTMIIPTGGKYGNGAYSALGSIAANFKDGYVLPASTAAITTAISSGNFNKVPMMVGNCAEEGKLFSSGAYKISDVDRFNMMMAFNPNAPGSLSITDILDPAVINPPTADNYNKYSYAYPSTYSAPNALPTQLYAFLMNVFTQSFQPQVGSQIYSYSFNWANQPEPWKTIYGASHGGDLPFVFGDFDRKQLFSEFYSTANQPGRLALSRAMQQSIAAFARTGNPNNSSLGVTWAPATTGTDGNVRKIIFDATQTNANISMSNN